MYLLASDWLIKHGKEVDGLDEAERQRRQSSISSSSSMP